MIVKFHVQIMLTAPPDSFELFVNITNWGSEHPIVDICIVSLSDLINCKRNNGGSYTNSFFSTYYMPIVRHTFKIIFDTVHKFDFAEQADLLRSLLGGFSYYLNPDFSVRDFFPWYSNI